jgi:AcrR family transcriptional regulator
MGARKATAITRNELYQRVWSKPLSAVAKDIGVSGNALAKICNRLLVPYPSRGYWSKAHVGKAPDRPPLPPAPEIQAKRVTISAVRAGSRRARTRLSPSIRRDQLLDIAAQLVREGGLHAATMRGIATVAGISETQAYNYFGSREKLLSELARREFARIREIRRAETSRFEDHYAKVRMSNLTYLRQIAQKGGMLQILLSSPQVREMLRREHRKRQRTSLRAHAQSLVEKYGIPWPIALGCTVVLTRLSVRAGHIIADGRISLKSAERLALAMILNGSRRIVGAHRTGGVGGAQGLKAAEHQRVA